MSAEKDPAKLKKERAKAIKTLEANHPLTFESLLRPRRLVLWNMPTLTVYHNNNDVHMMVWAMMLEFIDTIPLFRKYPIDLNSTYVNAHEVLTLQADDVPFFIIQVEDPGLFEQDADSLSRVHGRMFDYLISLHRDHGNVVPYGMISTYNQTQVCWLSDVEACTPTRTLNVSRIFSIQDHKATATAIANFILLAHNSERIRPKPRTVSGFLSVFHTKNMAWRELKCETLQYILPNLTEIEHDGLFLLQYFRRGAEGKAYHVCSPSGKQAVVKFYFNDWLEEKSLEAEVELWEKINQVKIFELTLRNQRALLIPYLEPLTTAEMAEFLDKKSKIYQQVTNLIRSCVETGWYQDDASWRHIGWYKYQQEPQLMLFDFGHTVSVEERKKSKETIIDEIFEDLRSEINDKIIFQKNPFVHTEDKSELSKDETGEDSNPNQFKKQRTMIVPCP